MAGNNKTILYVDDDDDDIEFLSDAIKNIDTQINIATAKNGAEALDYLRSIQHLPCVIILDLNMPFLNGKETFRRIKADSTLQNIPVVVFTSSSNPVDQAMFTNLGIAFKTKPHNYADINRIATEILRIC